MKIHRLFLRQEFHAPAEKIWETFSDHERFGKMLGQSITRVKDSADPANVNGVNSVRRINMPLIPFEETIRKSEKPNRIEYQITKNSLLAHHYGTILFKNLPGERSAIEYTIEFGSNVPLWAVMVKTVLQFMIMGRMKKYAKRLKSISEN